MRHVVVTGGTGALGSAVAGLLLERGAVCHVSCVKEDELRRFPYVKHERVRIHNGTELTDEGQVSRMYAAAAGASRRDAGESGHPGIWAAVNIAGGFAMGPIEETSADDFLGQWQTNALTCFLSCREAVKAMKEGGRGGRIVNVAARPGLMPELGAGMVAYTAAKAAVAAITQALAAEVAEDGILVNAVVPSIMDTPANRRAMPDARHDRWPKTEEVAATIAFLASPENRVTRGGLVPVYGRS
jgi:NAD(P)-dependent dehydrogenase (short-subunit alcohol dehydrogenase family)